ncbi:DUF6624 domain-containing protein [Sphingomicrobium arenosum]|uniref:DUF6624 domain-containing protein n=1 Tax=Sphingomicrobium arenosum TaxID=2233861 RepID=UPI002241020D|nr:DUF6624 domain-containing protein [Sphingomicrobium arenosum]
MLLTIAVAIAFTDPGPAPAPPEALAPYLAEHGEFKRSGGLEWLGGAFADAPSEERVLYAEAMAWHAQCRDWGQARSEAEVAKRGMEQTQPITYSIAECGALHPDWRETVEEFDDRATFLEALGRWEAYLAHRYAVIDAVRAVTPDPASPHYARVVSPLVETTDQFFMSDFFAAPRDGLDAAERKLAWQVYRDAIDREIRRNVTLVKPILADGWPAADTLTVDEQTALFYTVQHADGVPWFQLDALDAMRAALARGNVKPHQVAMLTDRVMIELRGEQLYGSQFRDPHQCDGERHIPNGLIDPEGLAERRAEMGMDPMEDYLERLHRLPSGNPCAVDAD